MVLRNNTTGEYARFESDDDPAAVALLDLRQSAHPTEPQWQQTDDPGLEDSGAVPSIVVLIPPVPAADDYTDESGEIQMLPKATTIESINYIPNGNITGVNTNSRSLVVSDTNGTVATLAFTAGVNATKGEPTPFPLSETNVPVGDSFQFQSEHVGTGLADPGGLIIVTFAGNESLANRDFGDSDAGSLDENASE